MEHKIMKYVEMIKDQLLDYNQIGGENEKKDIETEFKEFIKTTEMNEYLYPYILDPKFNEKIAKKKEFNDTQYDDKTYDVKEQSEKVCGEKSFELMPHQMFVRNFLSFNTPYNNLLLYHGLGTGKTCSAILVCEEMRTFLKETGMKKRIIIVASPNVQDNFRRQLFDETKLIELNGLWSLKACSGNKFINEVNPMKMKGLTKHKIKRQIENIISSSYLFLGYEQFSNYINRIFNKSGLKGLKKEFSNRLIVIDEVHNIRLTQDSPNKKVAKQLLKMVKQADNLKLLLLSATPMYNSYKEIIWLINLMNINDNRYILKTKDVFDMNGDFVVDDDGKEVGKELLIQKSIGYISFIRGENPYSFPYRIWPNQFIPTKSIKNRVYPKKQLNGVDIPIGIEHLDIFIGKIGLYQKKGYDWLLEKMKEELSEDKILGLGYQTIGGLLQALNMIFPIEGEFKKPNDLFGKKGLDRVMLSNDKSDFEYKKGILSKFGRFFSLSEIGKYSHKIEKVCKSVQNSDGIILIYTQYIYGGCIPIALALEEMGLRKWGGTSLLKKSPKANGQHYIMITGDQKLSPNNAKDIVAVTAKDNLHGEKIKVIIISKAGSEGLDFKNIRQIHILDPWYNTNRIEQIIGRGVRTCSHKDLSFEERNCEIYLHGTWLNDVESADLYTYRLAEQKAKRIGVVSRVLKENAIDCILNKGQNKMSVKEMDQKVKMKLSSKSTIDYDIGDKSYSSLCDYMESCSYGCKPRDLEDIQDLNMDTYNEYFIIMNMDKIISRIRGIMKEFYVYDKERLIKAINSLKPYPLDQIDMALEKLVTDKNEIITDSLDRMGNLINIGNYYMFQPIELDNKYLSMYERTHPIDYKRRSITFLPPKPKKKHTKYKKIVTYIEKMMEIVRNGKKKEDIENYKWYELCHNIEFPEKEKYALYHILDVLSYQDKLELSSYLRSSNDVNIEMRDYFERYMIDDIILLNNNKKLEKMKWDKKKWRKLLPLERGGIEKKIIEKKKNIDFSKYVGLINKIGANFVFKIKITGKQQGVKIGKNGVSCKLLGKSNLKEILKELKVNMNGNIDTLCVLLELFLRKDNDNRNDGKVSFLNSTNVLIHKN